MQREKFWLVSEDSSGDYYHYSGFYKSGKPVFSIAIADAIHIASFENAESLFNILKQIIPCHILLVDNNSVTKVS